MSVLEHIEGVAGMIGKVKQMLKSITGRGENPEEAAMEYCLQHGPGYLL